MTPQPPRVAPADVSSLTPEQVKLLNGAEALMGFIPNDALTMARVPGLLEASASLVGAVFSGEHLDPEVRRLVAIMSSEAAGCRYCRAHTQHGALREGIDPRRLQALWDFERSDAFSPAQRVAMKVAWLASLTPNQAEDEHFEALRAHFSEAAILEIVSVVALFGFLNRWNDTLKTTVEAVPGERLEAAGVALAPGATLANARHPSERPEESGYDRRCDPRRELQRDAPPGPETERDKP